MPKYKPITADQRSRIVTMLRDGKTQYETAREVGVSSSTVNNVARDNNIKPDPKNARKTALPSAMKRSYNLEGRLELSDMFGEAIRLQVERAHQGKLSARDLKDLALAFGIFTDKRRLEDGESTSRSESRVGGAGGGIDLEAEFRKLDELAKREAEASEPQAED